jgi:hypothetical protein
LLDRVLEILDDIPSDDILSDDILSRICKWIVLRRKQWSAQPRRSHCRPRGRKPRPLRELPRFAVPLLPHLRACSESGLQRRLSRYTLAGAGEIDRCVLRLYASAYQHAAVRFLTTLRKACEKDRISLPVCGNKWAGSELCATRTHLLVTDRSSGNASIVYARENLTGSREPGSIARSPCPPPGFRDPGRSVYGRSHSRSALCRLAWGCRPA